MAVATKEQILKVLHAFNPWWTTGGIHPDFIKQYRRFAYHEAMKRLDQTDLRRTVVLTGIRRVGKTTIQYQIPTRCCAGASSRSGSSSSPWTTPC